MKNKLGLVVPNFDIGSRVFVELVNKDNSISPRRGAIVGFGDKYPKDSPNAVAIVHFDGDTGGDYYYPIRDLALEEKSA